MLRSQRGRSRRTSVVPSRRLGRPRSRRVSGVELLEPRLVLDSTVVFNELMYNPGADQDLEWVELHNQMAVDMDISHWRVDGLGYTFPEGAVVPGGGYLVLAKSVEKFQAATGLTNAYGPYTGQLSNAGEMLRLLNNSDCVMDQVDFTDRDPWPVGPDGSGSSLAKRNEGSASGDVANWATSSQTGGTPGAANTAAAVTLFEINEVAAGGTDDFWIEIANRASVAASLDGFVLQVNESPATSVSLDSRAVPAEGYLPVHVSLPGVNIRAGDRLFLYAPGRSQVVDAVAVDGRLRGRSAEYDQRWLYPSGATPGETNRFALETEIVINEIQYHAPGSGPTAAQDPTYDEQSLVSIDAQTLWRYRAVSSGLAPGWASEVHEVGMNGWETGAALIGFESAALEQPIRTVLTNPSLVSPPIATYYFEHDFQLDHDLTDDATLELDYLIDDGAVFYLNGVEVHRFNMLDGPVTADTLATQSVLNAVRTSGVVIPHDALVRGTNRLSVEVHQSELTSNDVVLGVELRLREFDTPFIPATPYEESDEEWIELYNRDATRTVDLSHWRLTEAVEYEFPAGTSLGPGEYLVVARDASALREAHPELNNILGSFSGSLSNRDERLRLVDDFDNPADEVHYFHAGRWPAWADGGGATLQLRDPWADNSQPEAWDASDSSDAAPWQTITYRGVMERDGFTNGITTRYREFIVGLLDSGEFLIDDVSVIEDPAGTAIQRIQNGTFEQDAIGAAPRTWRVGGNHHGTVVADPLDPTNHVLLVTATGAWEDRVNHAETTFVGNASYRYGTEYEISLRAKWLRGSNQLNTHLYFDRLQRTSALERPEKWGTPGEVNQNAVTNLGPTYGQLEHQPAVPDVGQPVTVRVVAADPQGVAGLQLWYRVNGGTWQSGPMQSEGHGRFAGQIPGQSASAIVQFYVAGTDQLDAISYFPATGPASRALYKVQDGLARTGQMHNFRIIMTADDTKLLHLPTNVMSNDRLGATVIYNEQEVFYDVGVRLKGSNAGRADAAYLGFNVDFDPMQLFRGVHDSVAIDRSGRSSLTPQTQDEILIKHIGNRAGDIPYMYDDLVRVITPDPRHTRAALLMMSRYGDEFLDSQFENGSEGTLFRLDITYVPNSTTNGNPESLKLPYPYSHPLPAHDLQDMGDDKEAYRAHLQIRNNRAADDYSGIMQAAKTLSLSGTALDAAVWDVIDVDEWARVFALQSLTGAADVYSRGDLHHNMEFYVRPSDGRVLAFPWDWDFAFTAPTSDALIGSFGRAARLLARPGVRRLVYGHMLDIMNTTFNNQYLDPWIDHYASVAGQTLSPIKRFVTSREKFVRSRLPAAIPFEITTQSGADFNVDKSTVTLQGRGWINVHEIRRAGTTQNFAVRWLDDETWQLDVSLAGGTTRSRSKRSTTKDKSSEPTRS